MSINIYGNTLSDAASVKALMKKRDYLSGGHEWPWQWLAELTEEHPEAKAWVDQACSELFDEYSAEQPLPDNILLFELVNEATGAHVYSVFPKYIVYLEGEKLMWTTEQLNTYFDYLYAAPKSTLTLKHVPYLLLYEDKLQLFPKLLGLLAKISPDEAVAYAERNALKAYNAEVKSDTFYGMKYHVVHTLRHVNKIYFNEAQRAAIAELMQTFPPDIVAPLV